ncbi:MAG: TolC family protein [Acidobacteria bacterium]|nr:TolC family protein [Acidobacteriota bacterium]
MSSKVTLSLVAPFVCALVVAQNASAQVYSANDLVQIAIERSRELQAMQQRVVEARGLLRQAGMRPTPSLQFEGATGRPLGSPGEEEYTAGYSQPLEMAGKRDKRIRVAEKGVALAEAELSERTRQLVIDVKLRYVDAVTERAKLAALDRLIGTYKESAKLTEARVQQGDAAPLDGQLLLVELNRAEALRRTITGRVGVALADLRRLCGFSIAEPMNLSVDSARAPASKYTLDELVSSALAQRQDLHVARIVEERASAEVNLTEAQSRADLTLTARYSLRNGQFSGLHGFTASGQPAALRDRDNILAFGVSFPLLSRKRNLGNIEAAAARATGSRSLKQHLEATIPLEVQAAWQHWDAATQSLRILSSGVLQQSEKNIDVIRQAYALGQLRLLDVLNEQRRLIDIQMNFIDAEADVRRGVVELERAVGGDLK